MRNRYRLLALFLLLPVGSALANPDVTSREYKLMLHVAPFSYSTESATVTSLLDDAHNVIEHAINRSVSGLPWLEKQRDISFFDTQGSCELRRRGYSLRERVENGASEVALKFRSPDRYLSDFEDVSSGTPGAETKLESDVSANANEPFKVVYSHSTKAPNVRTINKIEDVNVHFPEFQSHYGLDDDLALSLVGNLSVREHVYRGVEIDLGQHDAQISVTLWYQGIPSGSQKPLVAEISFKYEDVSADYTRKVVNRAKASFEALKSLSGWVDSDAKTKTTFVYEYIPTFCQ